MEVAAAGAASTGAAATEVAAVGALQFCNTLSIDLSAISHPGIQNDRTFGANPQTKYRVSTVAIPK
jgi:hypothetical protein